MIASLSARTGFAACAAFSLVSTLSAVELFNADVLAVMNGGGSDGSPSVYTINDGATRSFGETQVGSTTSYNRFVLTNSVVNSGTSYVGHGAASGYNSVL